MKASGVKDPQEDEKHGKAVKVRITSITYTSGFSPEMFVSVVKVYIYMRRGGKICNYFV